MCSVPQHPYLQPFHFATLNSTPSIDQFVRHKYDTVDDVLIPLGIIFGALILGWLVERLIIRRFARREQSTLSTAARMVSALHGIVTLWAGLIATAAVLEDFPLRASAFTMLDRAINVAFIASVTLVLLRLVVIFVRRYSTTRDRALPSISIVENIARAIVMVLGLLMIFRAVGVSVAPMLTALGVGGLAVALALQDTLSNLFAGVYIIVSKQLDPGDFIKLSTGEEGYIRDIAWRVTTLRTPSNTLIIVPNSKFATSIITNFDKPEKFTGVSIPFVVDAESDLDSYSAMLIDAANSQRVIDPTVRFTSFNQTEATLTLSFRLTEISMKHVVLDALLRDVYQRSREGGFTKPRTINLPIVQVQRMPDDSDEEQTGFLKGA